MRTIKFRGIDATGRKGWVYGDLVHNQRVTETGTEPRVMVGGYEVVPESVGQFTSLRDINGKDIYEGDILEVNYADEESYLEVRFVRGVFAFLWNGDLDDEFPCNAPTHEWARVVGNIHDNPKMIMARNGEFRPVRIDENTLLTENNEYLEEKIRIFAEDCEEAGVEWSSDLDYIARHFFELGLNLQKK